MDVDVIVVPYDSGRRGERMGRGPHRLLEAAVSPTLTRMGVPYRTHEIVIPDAFTAEIKTAFAVCRAVAGRVAESRATGRFPLVLSGNCNAAVGTIAGCGCATTGVVWFDAHGEATTPDTTTSGFLDGMGVSILTGRCWRKLASSIPGFQAVPGDRIALIGARDLEPEESALLDELGVRRTLDTPPPGDGAYLHFDLDVLDPSDAAWNQWAPPDGMTVEAVRAAVRRTGPIKAAGFASFDPAADSDARAVRAAASVLEALLERL